MQTQRDAQTHSKVSKGAYKINNERGTQENSIVENKLLSYSLLDALIALGRSIDGVISRR